MLIGVSKVAQSGFLSGLNNFTVSTMKHAKYQPYFGFTEPEVKIVLSDMSFKMKRVKKLYNGYTVPFLTQKDKENSQSKKYKEKPVSLFNPWSITSYKESKELKSFWVNTSSTSILQDFIQRTIDFPTFKDLVLKIPIGYDSDLQHDMPYTNIKKAGIQEIITFMFNVGFLTQDKKFKLLRIPNEEIRGAMVSMLRDIIFPKTIALVRPYKYFQEDKVGDFGRFLMQVMFQAFFSFDFTKDVTENTCHVMMLILWYPRIQGEYKISSNVNPGRRKCDLMIHPCDTQKPPIPPIPAVLFEFKKADSPKKENRRSDLELSAQAAINQIAEKLYSYAVPGHCKTMYEVGMSFYQRDFYFLWNKRKRVGNKKEHVDDDHDEWSAPLESGFFCSLDATLCSERTLVIRE
jgi:Predicted AAA-ATPase